MKKDVKDDLERNLDFSGVANPTIHIGNCRMGGRTGVEMKEMYLKIDELLNEYGFEIERIGNSLYFARLEKESEFVHALRKITRD